MPEFILSARSDRNSTAAKGCDALRVLGGRNFVVGLLRECVNVRVDVAEVEVAGVAVVPLGGLLVGDA